MSLGGYAYRSLVATDDMLSPIFAELSDKFVAFVDVLSEVSERTPLTNDADLLRLYERWLRTGGRRNGDLLAEHGIVPNASVAAAHAGSSSRPGRAETDRGAPGPIRPRNSPIVRGGLPELYGYTWSFPFGAKALQGSQSYGDAL